MPLVLTRVETQPAMVRTERHPDKPPVQTQIPMKLAADGILAFDRKSLRMEIASARISVEIEFREGIHQDMTVGQLTEWLRSALLDAVQPETPTEG